MVETAIQLHTIKKNLSFADQQAKWQEAAMKDLVTKELKKLAAHYAREEKPHSLMPDAAWHQYLGALYEATDKIDEGQGSKSMGDWYWVTINPPVDDIDKLRLATEKFCKRKNSWNNSAVWAYEQRSEDENWYGFHVHILFNRKVATQKTAPKVIKDALWKDTQDMCVFPVYVPGTKLPFKGSKAGDAAIHCRPVKEGTQDRVFAYLMGEKVDAHKEKPSLQNEQWRGAIGLEQIYGNADVFQSEVVVSEEEYEEEDLPEEEYEEEKRVTFAQEGLDEETQQSESVSEGYSEEDDTEEGWGDAAS